MIEKLPIEISMKDSTYADLEKSFEDVPWHPMSELHSMTVWALGELWRKVNELIIEVNELKKVIKNGTQE
jgi:hypothetical protein